MPDSNKKSPLAAGITYCYSLIFLVLCSCFTVSEINLILFWNMRQTVFLIDSIGKILPVLCKKMQIRFFLMVK